MIKKIIFKVLRNLLTFLIKVKAEKLIAFLIIQSIKKNNPGVAEKDNNVLIFEKPRFINDVIEIDKYSDFYPIILKMKISVILGKIFLPEEVRGQHKYHKITTEKNISMKKKYRSFISKILPLIVNELSIKAILVGNVDYWEHQEWSWAAKNIGIPTVVLYRESVGWSERNIKLHKHYSSLDYDLPISKLAVFGPETQKWMSETGLVEKKDIIVTGAPRTDKFYEFSSKLKNDKTKKLVVLFDFISQKYSSSKTPVEVLEMFTNIANNSNEYEFLIKTKEDIYKKELMNKIFELKLPTNNLTVESDIDFREILQKSKLIIGYMRYTVMLESMIAKCPIILPVWGDLTDEDLEISKSESESAGVYKVIQKENFIPTVNKILAEDQLDEFDNYIHIRDQYIYKNLYKIDGKSSIRLSNVIEEAIKDEKS